MDIWNLILYLLNIFNGFLSLFLIFDQPTPSPEPIVPNPVYKNPCPPGFVGDNCETECGLTFFQQNQKIVGGEEAVPHSWPAQVLLYFKYENEYYLEDANATYNYSLSMGICGGTLIDRTTVLTAAHCIIPSIEFVADSGWYQFGLEPNEKYPTNESMYTIYVGLHRRSDLLSDNIYPAVGMKVKRITVHEAYNDEYKLNDIAIIKLQNPVTLNSQVQVACLPYDQSTSYPANGEDAYIVGWGLTQEGGKVSDTLMNTKVKILNGPVYCDQYIGGTNWETQICSGVYAGGKDTCQGDSGGPLYVKSVINGKTKFVDAGVVSYGFGCARPKAPGIYTRNSAFLDWIEKNRH